MKRRTLLQATAAVAAASTLGALSPSPSNAAQRKTQFQTGKPPVGFRPLQTESNDLTPYTGAWTDDTLRHLLRRSMFGVPQAQFEAAKALGGMSKVLDKLLEVPALPNPPGTWVNGTELLQYFASGKNDMTELNKLLQQDNTRTAEVMNWWLDMMMQENLSIREKMTLLWSNHFVTGSQTVNFTGFMYQYLQTCRKYSLGNLITFTRAISIDAAMLVYLNGNQNFINKRGSHINENFARELMELFTLGLLDPKTGQPNYTESDIQNAARALAGWQPTSTAPFTGVLYDGTGGLPDYRDNTNKTFLGHTGNWYLDDILGMIFGLNGGYNTAYFFCQKIYQALVYYVPNAGVVDAMAQLMVTSKFEIEPVVRALLSSAHFYDTNVIGAQLKSPAEFFGSLVREFNLEYHQPNNSRFDPSDPPLNSGEGRYDDTNPTLTLINTLMAQQGQQLLNPPNVKGWAGGHSWISTGTFQNREGYSYIILNDLLANYTDPKTKITYNLKFDPDSYSGQIANATTISGDELSLALEKVSSAFTFGPFEGGDLATLIQTTYPKPNYKYNSADVKNFSIYLAVLPEFQLF